ncbi:RBR-type E3 ubiquitin transferase [Aphelenchoides besseyi]|nr:RBR-type E3 ubiquitin transferase [Aphelenchoides besseyi]
MDSMDYKILSPEDLYAEVGEMALRVSDVTDLRPSICKVLLNTFRWNAEELVDRLYSTSSKQKFLRLQQVSKYTSFSEDKSRRCEICFSNDVDDRCIGTGSCEHSFCRSCYRRYVELKINDHEWLIRCPAGDCVLLTEDHVYYLVDDERLKRLYKQAMIESYVQTLTSLRNCPGVDCDYTWSSSRPNTSNLMVTCGCGSRFCFDCQSADHSPATCTMMAQWTTLDQNGYACYDWLMKNTKKCPGCKVIQSMDLAKQMKDDRYNKQHQRHLMAIADRDRILALKVPIEPIIANRSETNNSDVLMLQKTTEVLTETHQLLAFSHIYVFFMPFSVRTSVKNITKGLRATAEDLELILNKHLFNLMNNKHPVSRKRFDEKIDKIQKQSSKLLAVTRSFNNKM